MQTAVVITPPSTRILSPTEMCARLGLATLDQSDLVTDLIDAATAYLDGPFGTLGRCLGSQTLELRLDDFSFGYWAGSASNVGCPYPPRTFDGQAIYGHLSGLRLPFPQATSVSSVKYDDQAGTEQTLDGGVYRLIGLGSDEVRLILADGQAWPTVFPHAAAVRIRYVAGYPKVPAPIKQAVALMVRNLYSLGERNLFISTDTVDGVSTRSFVVSQNASQIMQSAVDNLLAPYRVINNLS